MTRTDGALARPGARFLIVWVALPTLLFTLSAGKRGVYLLPIFPALALVAALGFERVMSDRSPARRARVLGGWIAGVAAVELFAALALLPWLDAEKSPRPIAVAIARRLSPEESVGVYGLTPIEGAIGYYGRASEPGSEPLRVASLATEADLRAFNLGGGELVLLRERHWQTLGPRLGLTAVDHFRSGRRRLTLATFDPQIPEGSSSSLPEMLQ